MKPTTPYIKSTTPTQALPEDNSLEARLTTLSKIIHDIDPDTEDKSADVFRNQFYGKSIRKHYFYNIFSNVEGFQLAHKRNSLTGTSKRLYKRSLFALR